jgi:hypothetical protein
MGGVGAAAAEIALEASGGPEAVLRKEAAGGGQKAVANGGCAHRARRTVAPTGGRAARDVRALRVGIGRVKQDGAVIADQDHLAAVA